MKRKHGNKRGRPKKNHSVVANEDESLNGVSLNAEDNSGGDNFDNAGDDSVMDVDTPSPTDTNQQDKLANSKPVVLAGKPMVQAVYGRVKVKLKTPKLLEPQPTSLDAPKQGDIDKSSVPMLTVPQPTSLEKCVTPSEKKEESENNLLPQANIVVYGDSSKKAGSIKIKTSKGLDSLNTNNINNTVVKTPHQNPLHNNQESDGIKVPHNKPVHNKQELDDVNLPHHNPIYNKQELDGVKVPHHKPVYNTQELDVAKVPHHKPVHNNQELDGVKIAHLKPVHNKQEKDDIKIHHRKPVYNKRELDEALTVIKKIMNMDAAEPFNSPVDPMALGIPDYFNVIKTPMDFGTICSNLEKGIKYTSSEGVFKDVQHIWGNCYKYNNKGDYIVDLMKRVKKNFAKYWAAAGLYTEHTPKTHRKERGEAENAAAPSGQGQIQLKGGHVKQKKGKRQAFMKHKDGCLCAVCILMRRRREREENMRLAEEQAGTGQTNLDPNLKQEKTSPVDSPSGDDTSSNDPGSEDDLEGKGEDRKSEATNHHDYNSPQLDKQEEKANDMDISMVDEEETPDKSQHGDRSCDDPSRQWSDGVQSDIENDNLSGQVVDDISKDPQQELIKRNIYENLERFENPELLKLCDIFFPNDHKSVWSGPHSLFRRQKPTRKSSMHAAIDTFMKCK